MTRNGSYVRIAHMKDSHIENAMKDLARGITKGETPRKYDHALEVSASRVGDVPNWTFFEGWARTRLMAFRREQRARGAAVTVGRVRG